MMAKLVSWTTGGSPSHPDPLEFDINNLRPDEVLVRIDVHEAGRGGIDQNCSGEDTAHGSQEVCRGLRGLVMEAGADALWYVDRSVIIPADGSRCENCDSGQRDKLSTYADHQEIAGKDDDGTPARFVVVPARRLCVVSVAVDWQKPTST
jgi:D-arabinose 1-dehydrogenase-like Zn-dependent alcohol dehydrogenase